MLHRLVQVYTCQNITLLEMTCCGSIVHSARDIEGITCINVDSKTALSSIIKLITYLSTNNACRLNGELVLTHLCPMKFPTLINWTNLFRNQGLLCSRFQFYSNLNRMFCKQTVKNLIRRHVLWRLIWFCTVCRCPIKWTIGL